MVRPFIQDRLELGKKTVADDFPEMDKSPEQAFLKGRCTDVWDQQSAGTSRRLLSVRGPGSSWTPAGLHCRPLLRTTASPLRAVLGLVPASPHDQGVASLNPSVLTLELGPSSSTDPVKAWWAVPPRGGSRTGRCPPKTPKILAGLWHRTPGSCGGALILVD